MKQEKYRQFSDTIHETAATKAEQEGLRTPLDAMIELTRLCTIKCTHCYIGDARWTKDPNEMTNAQVKELLDLLERKGTLWVCFTGGEAMLRKDFKELWLYAKQKGFFLTLFTNATLLNDEMGDFLMENPPFNLEVSIYGATEETYERVSLVKGSYKRFMRGIEALRARPRLRWLLKTVAIQDNAHELGAMKDLAKQWGVEFKFDPVINPSVGEGKSGGLAPCATRVTEEEVVAIEMGDADRRKENFDWAQKACSTPKDDHSREESLYGCSAGTNSIYLTAAGRMQMCVLTPHRGNQITNKPEGVESSFDHAWDSFGEARKVKLSAGSPCYQCDIAYMCSNCPGFAQLENGDEQSAVEYLCKLTHKKAAMMGLKHSCSPKHFLHTSSTESTVHANEQSKANQD